MTLSAPRTAPTPQPRALPSTFHPVLPATSWKKEVKYFGDTLTAPQKPFVAILGGAKVSDKIMVIDNLMEKVDTIIIGGAMAYTMLKAKDESIGISMVEDDKLDIGQRHYREGQSQGC